METTSRTHEQWVSFEEAVAGVLTEPPFTTILGDSNVIRVGSIVVVNDGTRWIREPHLVVGMRDGMVKVMLVSASFMLDLPCTTVCRPIVGARLGIIMSKEC